MFVSPFINGPGDQLVYCMKTRSSTQQSGAQLNLEDSFASAESDNEIEMVAFDVAEVWFIQKKPRQYIFGATLKSGSQI